MRNRLLTLLLAAAISLLLNFAQNARSSESDTLNEDLLFHASDFEAVEGSGLHVGTSGLALAESANSGSYTSAAIEAPFPFNAVVPQWLADLPESSAMAFSPET